MEMGRRPVHTRIMDEKHPKRPRDLNQWAKRMVDIATGEAAEEPPPNETFLAERFRGCVRAAYRLNSRCWWRANSARQQSDLLRNRPEPEPQSFGQRREKAFP
jgi:hypothetical protein